MVIRTRFRLSPRLGALLLALVAVAGVLAWLFEQPRKRRRATETTVRLEGYVVHDEQYRVDHVEGPAPRPFSRAWLSRQLGPEFAHELTVINLDGRPITDPDLENLSGLAGLRRLYLNGTPIGDAGLSHLSGLTSLQKLELRETRVGDAGMEHLGGMRRLEELYLYGTKVGDDGMEPLARLPRLRELSLGRTLVGDAGLAHLAGATQLLVLKLGGTRVTDAGLAHVGRLKNLQHLDLRDTGITDAGLEHLAGLIELRLLWLDGTQVTEEGAGSSPKCSPACVSTTKSPAIADGSVVRVFGPAYARGHPRGDRSARGDLNPSGRPIDHDFGVLRHPALRPLPGRAAPIESRCQAAPRRRPDRRLDPDGLCPRRRRDAEGDGRGRRRRGERGRQPQRPRAPRRLGGRPEAGGHPLQRGAARPQVRREGRHAPGRARRLSRQPRDGSSSGWRPRPRPG